MTLIIGADLRDLREFRTRRLQPDLEHDVWRPLGPDDRQIVTWRDSFDRGIDAEFAAFVRPCIRRGQRESAGEVSDDENPANAKKPGPE